MNRQHPPALEALISVYHARKPPRTWSLLVTVFGDVALPSGAPIRLADLSDWMAALGIEPGLVRTALSRLVSNGTLMRERDGKSALYRLSHAAADDFSRAAELIYGRNAPVPSGSLTLALIEDGAERGQIRAQLAAQGFAGLAANVLIRPDHIGIAPALPMGVLSLAVAPNADLAARAGAIWSLEPVQQGYHSFIAQAGAMLAEQHLSADDAFLARLLLVHEFRRIVLRDPYLPQALLPPDWPGPRARGAFDASYRQLSTRANG